MHQKLVPDHFLILVNNPKQPLHARNYFENRIFWKRRTQSLLMDKVIKIKKGLELVTSCSLGYKTSTEKFLYLLCIIWQSLMMYYDAVFELLQKLHLEIYGSQFMTHKLFHFHLSFWIWNIWEKKQKNF